MRPTPWQDLADFLFQPTWQAGVYAALLLASLIAAIVGFRRSMTSPSPRAIGIWLLRVVVGSMWWQQSLWKLPPNYDGLLHWMGEIVDHSAIPLQAEWVHDYVIANIQFWGPAVYGMEVFVGVTLILGLFSRLGAFVGLLLAGQLWLGLYSAPGEWPWTYGFLIVIQALFVIDPPGRCLGVEALWGSRR